MKYKMLGVVACVVILLVSVVNLPAFLKAEDGRRVHQHKTAVQKPSCTHEDGVFCTHLPLMTINTGGVDIPGKAIVEQQKIVGHTTAADGSDRISAQMAVFDSSSENNHLTDIPAVTSDITIHVRGNSSRTFDKLGYRINLFDEQGNNNPQSLMGMDAHHEWALHGPFLDKTLIRNYMWYNIAGEIMDYAPNVRFCELILNGEYMGVYLLTENITAGRNGSRLDLTVNAKNNTFSGYCLLLDRLDDEEYNHLRSFSTYSLRTKHKLEIVYPGATNMTDEIVEGIKQDFSAFEKSLYSYDYDHKKYGYKNLIDVDSFVDYFLINEFTCNYDAGWLSTFLYKDVDGKFRMCIWDFNSACDNYQVSVMDRDSFELQNALWYFMLMKDEGFTARCVERYRELRETYLNEAYLNAYIDDVVAYLGPAIDRNYEKWGYSFGEEYDMLRPADRNPRSHAESLYDMKNFLADRGAWMDENIETLKQYSAGSKVKKFEENTD